MSCSGSNDAETCPPPKRGVDRAVNLSAAASQLRLEGTRCGADVPGLGWAPCRDPRGGPPQYNRKEKSLSLLCDRFLQLCGGSTGSVILLNDAARILGVQRRRIYDIVNVLEALEILRRHRKNACLMLGLENLPSFFAREMAIVRTAMPMDGCRSMAKSVDVIACGGEDKENIPARENSAAARVVPADHCLSSLARRFIRLFLVEDVPLVSLDDAAMKLFSTSSLENKRNCVRRVYDIANILIALRIIERVRFGRSRQTCFRWADTYAGPKAAQAVNGPTAPLSQQATKKKPAVSSPPVDEGASQVPQVPPCPRADSDASSDSKLSSPDATRILLGLARTPSARPRDTEAAGDEVLNSHGCNEAQQRSAGSVSNVPEDTTRQPARHSCVLPQNRRGLFAGTSIPGLELPESPERSKPLHIVPSSGEPGDGDKARASVLHVFRGLTRAMEQIPTLQGPAGPRLLSRSSAGLRDPVEANLKAMPLQELSLKRSRSACQPHAVPAGTCQVPPKKRLRER